MTTAVPASVHDAISRERWERTQETVPEPTDASTSSIAALQDAAMASCLRDATALLSDELAKPPMTAEEVQDSERQRWREVVPGRYCPHVIDTH
jgi:hypothetical protein